jgi:isoquinoline 1-oxidoreductase subunit beta
MAILKSNQHQNETFTINAFIRFGTDDTVTIIVNKSEMGQGVYTALPMLIVEELGCDLKQVRLEAAPVDPAYNHTEWGPLQGTGGSSSVRSEWIRFRRAGAVAREMLISAAADLWGVEISSCRAEGGRVIHESGKSITFGKLASRAAQLQAPREAALKDPSQFKVIGRPIKRLDTPDKTTGRAVFGMDVRIPGMLTALIARPPVFGGKMMSFRDDKTRAVPGVQDVVHVPSGVAVAADSYWSAKKGRDALEIVWDEGDASGLSTSELREQYRDLANKSGSTARRQGDVENAFAGAASVLSAEYDVPYLAHAMMEPLNCLVDFHSDHCDIWTGTQSQTVDRDAATNVLGLKREQVNLHTTLLGGGFGRRANPKSDFVTEAAHVAKHLRKPVMVVWAREDDIKGGYYRPMWSDKLEAALDAKNTLVAWRHTIVGQSILEGTVFKGMIKNGIDATSVEGAEDIPYDIPNIYVDIHSPKIGIPVQWWRSVGHSHTAFVVESFIDEVAHASQKDPFEFRHALLARHPRHRRVLELAAEKAGWGEPTPTGTGRGIALHESFGSFIAQVAEVAISEKGQVRVRRVVCAVDCGQIVNPDTVAAQMEGGIVFGLTAALYGAITLKNGRVEQSNFNNYPMLRMSGMPQIDVFVVQSSELPQGVGEPGVPPIAPAVTNAIFAATGQRIRRLPIKENHFRGQNHP